MTTKNFDEQQKKAIDELKNMHSRSIPTPPKPEAKKAEPHDFLSGLNIPFLENIKTNSDLTLILGLLLLLLNEKADRKLLFALLYILL